MWCRRKLAGPDEVVMTSSNSLSTKERALIGLGAAIGAGCQPCTRILIQAARKAGACERGIRLAIESGLVARTNATEAMVRWGEPEQGEPPILDAAFRAEFWFASPSRASRTGRHIGHLAPFGDFA